MLTEPFDVDMKIFDELKIKSINYLKKNLGIEENEINNNDEGLLSKENY